MLSFFPPGGYVGILNLIVCIPGLFSYFPRTILLKMTLFRFLLCEIETNYMYLVTCKK